MQMKKILVGATGALLLTGALATTAAAQDGRCKGDQITAAGKATFWGDKRAQRLAIDNWQREVRQKYGEQFMDFTKARQGRVDCSEAGIGAIGSRMKRCNVAGYPCHLAAAADDDEADKDWDDKDRRVYAIQRLLVRAGFLERDDVDGEFGPKTHAGRAPLPARERPESDRRGRRPHLGRAARVQAQGLIQAVTVWVGVQGGPAATAAGPVLRPVRLRCCESSLRRRMLRGAPFMRTRGDDDKSEAIAHRAPARSTSHARPRNFASDNGDRDVSQTCRDGCRRAVSARWQLRRPPASAGCRGYVQASAEGTFKLPTELLSRARWRTEVRESTAPATRSGARRRTRPRAATRRAGREVALRCTRASVRLIRIRRIPANPAGAADSRISRLGDSASRSTGAVSEFEVEIARAVGAVAVVAMLPEVDGLLAQGVAAAAGGTRSRCRRAGRPPGGPSDRRARGR